MDEPRDRLQREEADPAYRRAADGVPAHIEAAAEAAGEVNLGAGGQAIGYASGELGATALHGGDAGSGHAARRLATLGVPISIFDKQHPPDPDLIDDCVHCGFCLPDLPDLRAVGRGDGLAARAHLPDEAGQRGRGRR